MDKYTRDNWHKIKRVLEEAGKTDSFFYRRTVAICRGARDPFEDPVDVPPT